MKKLFSFFLLLVLMITPVLADDPIDSEPWPHNVKVDNAIDASAWPYNIRCDGTTDITSALNSLLTTAGGKGMLIKLPPGKCVIAGQLTVPNNTGLVGSNAGLTVVGGQFIQTTLLMTTTASQVLISGQGDVLDSLSFYYPNQVTPNASAPTVYPPTIQLALGATGTILSHLHSTNAYVFMSLQGGRNYVSDCVIGAYQSAITIDSTYDWTFISNVAVQVMYDADLGFAYPSNIDTWVMNNGYGLTIFRADSVVLNNFSVFSRYACILLADSPTSQPGGDQTSYGNASNVDCDTVQYGVIANSTQDGGSVEGWRFSNLVTSFSTAGIYLGPGGSQQPLIRCSNCVIRGAGSIGPYYGSPTNGQLWMDSSVGITGGGTVGLISGPPALPASGTFLHNPYPYPVEVCVNGGADITAVSLSGPAGGVAVTTGTSGCYYLAPTMSIAVYYSGAVTWQWMAL